MNFFTKIKNHFENKFNLEKASALDYLDKIKKIEQERNEQRTEKLKKVRQEIIEKAELTKKYIDQETSFGNSYCSITYGWERAGECIHSTHIEVVVAPRQINFDRYKNLIEYKKCSDISVETIVNEFMDRYEKMIQFECFCPNCSVKRTSQK
jgi:hypothetical protein